MRNITGQPVRNADFFDRPNDLNRIISELSNGGSLQIVAPRRVGKTSIMYRLLDTNRDHYFVYLDAEAVEDINEYFKKLYRALLSCRLFSEQSFLEKFSRNSKGFWSRIKGVRLLEGAVDIIDDETINYHDEFINLIKGVDSEGKTIVMQIDEFPEVILNLIKKNNGDTKEAETFLMANRELRQNPEINNKVQFIYTGSVGLNTTVKRIGMTRSINDIIPVQISALSPDEAYSLINQISQPLNISFPTEISKYLCHKVGWLIPFHIQLVIKEIKDLQERGTEVTTTIIDQAFDALIQARNNIYFQHYRERLDKLFKGEELKFCIEVLCFASANSHITYPEIHNIAVKYRVETIHLTIVEELMYDGYLNNNDNKDQYIFNSPVIKYWWQSIICK